MNTVISVKPGRERICGIEVSMQKAVYIYQLPEVKFSNFYNIYQINPDKYELLDGYVVRHEKDKDIAFSFNFFDYNKYTKFRNKEVKNRKNEKMLKELIELTKGDIESTREKARSEIEQAREITERIMKGG